MIYFQTFIEASSVLAQVEETSYSYSYWPRMKEVKNTFVFICISEHWSTAMLCSFASHDISRGKTQIALVYRL